MISTTGSIDTDKLTGLFEQVVDELGRLTDHASRIADELGNLNEQLEQLNLPDSSGYLELDPAVADELGKIRMAIQDANRSAATRSRMRGGV